MLLASDSAYYGFLGILVVQVATIIMAFINRHFMSKVSDRVDSVHDQVKSKNGTTTGDLVDDTNKKVDVLSEKVEQVSKNSRDLIRMVARHGSDGHGVAMTERRTGQKSGQKSRSQTPQSRRNDDPGRPDK